MGKDKKCQRNRVTKKLQEMFFTAIIRVVWIVYPSHLISLRIFYFSNSKATNFISMIIIEILLLQCIVIYLPIIGVSIYNRHINPRIGDFHVLQIATVYVVVGL